MYNPILVSRYTDYQDCYSMLTGTMINNTSQVLDILVIFNDIVSPTCKWLCIFTLGITGDMHEVP